MVEDVRLALEGKGHVHFYGRPGGVVPMPVELSRIISRHYYQAQAGRQEEEAMKTVYARPKLLKEAHFHYCPGCGHGIINRLLMEVIEEMDLQGRRHLRRSGRVRHAPLQLLRDRRDRVGPRPRRRRGHRHQAGAAAEPGLLLPGRRRPGRHRHRRGLPRRQPGREHHRDLRQQRRVRHDRRPDGADHAARPGDHHHPDGTRRRARRPPGAHLRGLRPARRHVLPGARGRQQAGRGA